MLHYHVMFYIRHYISVSGSSHLDFNVTDFHCYCLHASKIAPVYSSCFSSSLQRQFHAQSIYRFIGISYEMLLIYRTCYVGYQSMMHPVHYTTLSCNLYILSNAAIYEMLLTYTHVMLVINLWCIRCMIRFYHACLLYILSTATVCFYPWCVQCILAMLLPVDSFKVLRDVVLRDAWFTCYRSILLILYLRYIPLIYVACSTCYHYIMILIQLGLHVTNIATNN